jgi:hypothetical protein
VKSVWCATVGKNAVMVFDFLTNRKDLVVIMVSA